MKVQGNVRFASFGMRSGEPKRRSSVGVFLCSKGSEQRSEIAGR
jgi:hypothetical protein